MIKRPAFFLLKTRPYDLLGEAALLLFVVSFIPSSTGAFDVNMHDTYFVFTGINLHYIFSGLLLSLWSVNMLARRVAFSLTLTWVHVVLTLIPVVVFLLPVSFFYQQDTPKPYYALTEFEERKSFFTVGTFYVFIVVLFVIAQLVLVGNIVAGAVKLLLAKRKLREYRSSI